MVNYLPTATESADASTAPSLTDLMEALSSVTTGPGTAEMDSTGDTSVDMGTETSGEHSSSDSAVREQLCEIQSVSGGLVNIKVEIATRPSY